MSIVEGAAPPPEGVVPNLEHPEDVLHTINFVSQILSFTTVTLFMLLRIYAKAFVAPPFHAEDWVAVVAWFLTLGYGSTALAMSHYGGGYHIWELSEEALEGFMKIHAKCFNEKQIFVADTVISAVSDLAVLCLPIPAAVRLRMSWNRRLKVMAMLSAGGIATAASLVRMVIVIRLQASQDPTVDFIRFNLPGTAEVSIGMICACFPAINILLMHRAEGSRESSRNTTSVIKANLKFLGGSRLRTQRMTEVQTMPQTVPQTVAMEEGRVPPPTHQTPQRASQETGDCIFPIERLSRLPPALQRTWNKETWPDEWCTNLCTSPFSDPGAPEWARKGAGAD
ncbi:hypothetical protein CSUB01_01494 [Colletotrichum sublineola]|uniref:Rhodopsin domain-containing protein n=1 Tax=Colletotrichum sublineola TaxID=1173701 RepID=A0A066XI20_COLSU|nr:hypothetical protein CSUB01_01494 [Colletotrichum sublineola]